MRTLVLVVISLLLLASCKSSMLKVMDECKTNTLTTYESCIKQKAEEKGSRLCRYVDANLKDSCYLHAALGQDDADLCILVNDRGLRDNCFGSLALYTGDLEILELMEDSNKRDEWYITIAVRKNESTICRKITDSPPNHGKCFYEMVKLNPDPKMCFFIDSNTLYKDACYYYIAALNKNPDFCIGVVGASMHLRCETDATVPPKPHK